MIGPYQIIYLDPPWEFRDSCNAGKRGAVHKYRTMSYEDLKCLPLHRIAATDCLLAMWWVPAMPQEALNLVSAWGFRLRTMTGFTWAKRTVNGRWAFGMGHWTRANQESVLFATRGKPKRFDAGISQLVESPIREHSRKPDEVADRLVRLMGNIKRVELFARTGRPGWDCFGLEWNDVRIEELLWQ